MGTCTSAPQAQVPEIRERASSASDEVDLNSVYAGTGNAGSGEQSEVCNPSIPSQHAATATATAAAATHSEESATAAANRPKSVPFNPEHVQAGLGPTRPASAQIGGKKPKLTVGLNNIRAVIIPGPTPEEIKAAEQAAAEKEAADADAAAHAAVAGESGLALLAQTTNSAVAAKKTQLNSAKPAAPVEAVLAASATAASSLPPPAPAPVLLVEPPKLFGGKPKLAPPKKRNTDFKGTDRAFLDNMMNSSLTKKQGSSGSGAGESMLRKGEGADVHKEGDILVFPTPGYIIKTRRAGNTEVKAFINVCHSAAVSRMFIPPSDITLDKNGVESILYTAILTEVKYKQMDETKDEVLKANISKALISHINKSRKDTLQEDFVLVKKAKNYVGNKDLSCKVPLEYNAAHLAAQANARESLSRDSMELSASTSQSISLPNGAPKLWAMTEGDEDDDDDAEEEDAKPTKTSIKLNTTKAEAGATLTAASTSTERIFIDRAIEKETEENPLWVRRKNDFGKDYWKNRITNERITYNPYVRVENDAADSNVYEAEATTTASVSEPAPAAGEEKAPVSASAVATETNPTSEAAASNVTWSPAPEKEAPIPAAAAPSDTVSEDKTEATKPMEFVYRPPSLVDELEIAGVADYQAVHYYSLFGGWLHKFLLGDDKLIKKDPPGCSKYENSVWLEGYHVELTGNRAQAAAFMITREKNGEKLRFSLIHEDKSKPQLHFISTDTATTERWMKICKEHIYFADWVSVPIQPDQENRFDKLKGRPEFNGMKLTKTSLKFACFARDEDVIVKVTAIEKPKSFFHVDSRVLILLVNQAGTHRLLYIEEKSMEVRGGFVYGTALGCTAVMCSSFSGAAQLEFDVTGQEKDSKSNTQAKTVKFRAATDVEAADWFSKINEATTFVKQ